MTLPTERAFHAIIACHNRRELTVRAVRAVVASATKAGAAVSITVFDDGSTDGTSDALRDLHPDIELLRGDGSAFWARSMATAEAHVLARTDISDSDLILWLNDDVDLDDDALSAILETTNAFRGAVVVGAMRDPSDGTLTYSGMTRAGIHPLRFEMVTPTDSLETIDTFNGNLVAIPVGIARMLGGIDGGFSHALADIDYGLRCARAGIPMLLLPGTQGACPRNPPTPAQPTLMAWRRFIGVKGGGHYASIRRIIRKSNPYSWPMWILATYTKWWATQFLSVPRKNS